MRAKTLADALNALAAGDGSKILAGGHSLMPLMRFRLAQPTRLVDIGGLRGAQGSRPSTARASGSAPARPTASCSSPRSCCGAVSADHRVPPRTSAIGRSAIAGRSAAAWRMRTRRPICPSVMLVLDATFNLRSKRGRRSVPAREFFLGPFATALDEDEMMIDIVLPALPKGAGTAYVSLDQPASGYSLAGGRRRGRPNAEDGEPRGGGAHRRGRVSRLVASADQLVGTKGEPEVARAGGRRSVDGIEINGDIHASAEYRRHLATVIVRRALQKALERAS